MATGFATFAAEGLKCEPRALESVTAVDGRTFEVPPQDCQQVMKKEVAQGVNAATQQVMTKGSGYNLQIGLPVAGKTGTNDYRSQTWFMGYTTGMVTASWLGNHVWGDERGTMIGKPIGGRVYPEIDGSLIAGPSWKNFIQRIPGEYGANPFTPPPASIMGNLPAPPKPAPAPSPSPAADQDNGGGDGDGGGNDGGGDGDGDNNASGAGYFKDQPAASRETY